MTHSFLTHPFSDFIHLATTNAWERMICYLLTKVWTHKLLFSGLSWYPLDHPRWVTNWMIFIEIMLSSQSQTHSYPNMWFKICFQYYLVKKILLSWKLRFSWKKINCFLIGTYFRGFLISRFWRESILRGFIFAISTRKCENRAGKASQFYIISLFNTEDTKRSSRVKPVIKLYCWYISCTCCCYYKFI